MNIYKTNKEIIEGLEAAIDKIEEQDKTIMLLRNKLSEEKEKLKDELEVDYRKMEEQRNRFLKEFEYAPFFFTEEEMNDYHNFLYSHNSPEEDDICPFAGAFSSNIIFHYYPEEFRRGIIVVECPHCHTKRKLGTGVDILEGRENYINE